MGGLGGGGGGGGVRGGGDLILNVGVLYVYIVMTV